MRLRRQSSYHGRLCSAAPASAHKHTLPSASTNAVILIVAVILPPPPPSLSSAIAPEARPVGLFATAANNVSYLDLKDMGPPPEPSARCAPHCNSVSSLRACLQRSPRRDAGTSRRPVAPLRPLQVPHACTKSLPNNHLCHRLGVFSCHHLCSRSLRHRQFQSCQCARHVAGDVCPAARLCPRYVSCNALLRSVAPASTKLLTPQHPPNLHQRGGAASAAAVSRSSCSSSKALIEFASLSQRLVTPAKMPRPLWSCRWRRDCNAPSVC